MIVKSNGERAVAYNQRGQYHARDLAPTLLRDKMPSH